ncbi:MAG: radical SAM/SPASM domain-containing protein [Armatimonadota bacterium]
MKAKDGIYLARRVLGYRLCRANLSGAPAPINLTLSVTNMCQSRCKTCGIWKLYREKPELYREELSLAEMEKVFASMGRVYFFNISGGEPFLRPDLPEIVGAALAHLSPAVIHTPTNALMPERIERGVRSIMEVIGGRVPFTIKPSFDGVGPVHDEIRGVPGNFEKVLDTLARLKGLQKEYPNLEVGLGTVISNFNLELIRETARCARKLGVDSYISEIAEQRTELFNTGEPITPDADEYERAIRTFGEELGPPGRNVSRHTLSFRQVYYHYAMRILREGRQVLPCYGGIANVHISPYGDVWPCCILGYDKSMGNLREHDYDFSRVWRSPAAREVRRFVAGGNCVCPLANQAYSNILCSPAAMLKVFREHLK